MSEPAPSPAGPSARRPLVSCVMTTWNGERYIRQAIDSALAQDYQPLEIVVIDDGSTDSTPEICRSYGDRIRYFQCAKCSKGGSTQVVRAYAEARGEYLAPLDHDDVWLPGKISRQVAALAAAPDAGAVFTRFREIDAGGFPRGTAPPAGPTCRVFHALLETNGYCYSSSMFPGAVLQHVGHHDVDAGIGDWDLWLRIARHYPVVMIDEILTEYRVHSGGYSIGRANMIRSSERVMNNQKDRVHPDCPDCRRAIGRRRDHLASDWLAYMTASMANRHWRASLAALGQAWRLSPRGVLYWCRTGLTTAARRFQHPH